MRLFEHAAVLGGLAGVVAGLAHPAPARAWGTEYCVNCATEGSSLMSLAKQAQQIEQQIQSYQLQLSQYQNMITNTVGLPMQLWGTVQSDIMQVRTLSNAASLLSGNAGGIVSRLQNAQGYANQAASLGNIAGQFTTWQQTIGNNVSTLGQTLGLQQSQQASNTALLGALEAHSQTAAGQMQAIQAGNELAHANAVQLQQIEQTLIATAQMQATGQAVDADRRAQEDAAMQHFAQPTTVPMTGREW